MRIDVEKKLFTRNDLSRMFETGILDPDERVELLDGEIIKMSKPGRRHIACSLRATTLFTEAFRGRALVSIQNPLVLDNYNEPKPDVVVLKPSEDFYESTELTSDNALLVVEISDTSLAYDRQRKLQHYAGKLIREYWIEDLKHRLLHVFRDPANSDYQQSFALQSHDSISPLAFPDVVFKVEDPLGSSK